MVDTSLMVSPIKKFTMVFIWMGIVAFLVIISASFFNFPDEVSGVLYFISIGVAVSGVLNYYR